MQCNDGTVTSTFVSFAFAKRFIEVDAESIEFFCTAFMIVVSLGPYLLTQNSFEELEYEPCEPWAGLECTSDTADSCRQMLKK